MKKDTKIVTIIIIVLVVFITSIDIITKGKITGLLGSVNPMDLKSSDVPYTNNNQSTVQGAIDDLYTKTNTLNTELTTCQAKLSQKVTSDGAESVGFSTNTAKTVFANSSGVCIVRNGKLNCFKINNWSVEKDHIQQVFSDVSCNVNSSYVYCSASDFDCYVYSYGSVGCFDPSDSSFCGVNSGGFVDCD